MKKKNLYLYVSVAAAIIAVIALLSVLCPLAPSVNCSTVERDY